VGSLEREKENEREKEKEKVANPGDSVCGKADDM